jgi:hypothetical protein
LPDRDHPVVWQRRNSHVGATLAWGSRSGRIITDGTKVQIKQTASINGRPHLLQHARQSDVGTVTGPPQRSPKMAKLYVIVRFDECGQNHRLLEDELKKLDA